MKKILLAFVIFLLGHFSFAQKTKQIKVSKLKNDTIVWETDSVLSTDDFKAKPQKNSLGTAGCALFVGARESAGQLIFYVEALFLESKSFINRSSDYALKHEQVYFDICEVYARKLRQMMAEKDFTKIKNVQQEIQSMYTKVNGDMTREENRYEQDTQGGLNAAKQQLWIDNVDKELKALQKYSATDVNIVHK